AMLCQSGQLFGVLLSGNVGSAQQKKLKEVLKGTTHKFVKGTCEWGKGDIYTFVLDSPLSGAAAGLKKFFQEHAGASYKIRVGIPGAMKEAVTEAKAGTSPKEPPRPGTKPDASSAEGKAPASPTLSTYVKAKKEWKGGKAAAEKGLAEL